ASRLMGGRLSGADPPRLADRVGTTRRWELGTPEGAVAMRPLPPHCQAFVRRLVAGGRCGFLGDRADVTHERQRVPLSPALGNLAVRVVAVNRHALYGVAHRARGLEAHELVLERPLPAPAQADLVASLEYVLDRDVDVGEGRPV